MIKKIFTTLGIVAIIGIVFFVIQNQTNAPVAEQTQEQENGPEKIIIDPSLSGQTLPLSTDPKDVAWTLFEKYIAFNKTKNIEGVRSTVYKIAAVCEDPKTRIDCEARMGAAYSYGRELQKQDFKNVWSDERQTILATDFWIEDSEQMGVIGRFRSIIFFVKNEKGELRLLSFSPTKGGATSRGEASQQELEDRIIRWSEDKDEDGIADYDEECLGAKEGQTCTKTNPKLRDSDGNGFWDGIQALMK